MATSDNNDIQIETEADTPNEISETQKIVIFSLATFIIGIGVGFVLADENTTPADTNGNATTTATTTQQTDNADLSAATSTTITVNNQPAGSSVVVQSATIDRVGWAAVYENNDGQPGTILGARLIPQAGEWSGEVPLLEDTEANQTYFVKLLNDNGDREFNHEEDLPIENAGGDDVMTEFETIAASPRG